MASSFDHHEEAGTFLFLGGWRTEAWHGDCHVSYQDFKKKPQELRYKFKTGAHVVTAVKLWQIPGHDVYVGRVDVKWWDGAGWQPVTSQSLPGFENLVYGEEITINFDRVLTEQLRLDMYIHEKASRDIGCVGAQEIEILGCSA